MIKRAILAIAAVGILGLSVMASPPALAAQDSSAPADRVVAKVNGTDIRASDLRLASEELGPQIAGIPPQQRIAYLVQYLIERYLVVQAAEAAKTTETAEFKKRLRYYAGKALRDAYVKTVINPQVTDKDVKRVYDKEVAQIKPEDEVRARQIFVKTEAQAKEIYGLLKRGRDFAELAKERSVSPTALRGGDLGYFTKDKVEPVFRKIAFSLKKGEISKPFKVKFGWQIIKIEGRRVRPLQTLDKVKAGIRNLLQRAKLSDELVGLRKKAKIKYLIPEANPPVAPKTVSAKPPKKKK